MTTADGRRGAAIRAGVAAAVLLGVLGSGAGGELGVGEAAVPVSSAQTRPSGPEPTPARTSAASEVPLADLLGRLVVEAEGTTDYHRDDFRHWLRRDGSPCDTRREVLIRDGAPPPSVLAPCVLRGGSWTSRYDGLSLTDPRRLDIDHVVPLAEAWQSGASEWTAEERAAFANDLGVVWALLAVSQASNRSKQANDPAEWLPPLASAHCDYAVIWIQVKARWALSVDARERDALSGLVRTCGPQIAEFVRFDPALTSGTGAPR